MTDAERLKLQTRLAQAEEAYHQMQMGAKASVIVDSNGERMEFAKSNASSLAAYIADLKRQLGICGVVIGPMGVLF